MNPIFDRHLNKVLTGQNVEITYADGETRAYGEPGKGPRLRFHDRGAERAVLLDPELRFGEMFTEGRLTVENGRIFDVLMQLGQVESAPDATIFARFLAVARTLTRRFRQNNTRTAARANIAHHYDLDSGLYELFLDPDQQYSCAYFETDNATLEEAQLVKKRRLAAKLCLKPGMRVLDIGSGWGGLGLYLAEMTGAQVTGVTLSEHQHRISNQRARERGLADRVQFHLRDYRQIEGNFDRIVSVGMFEHVGVGFYNTFFETCRKLLTEEGNMLLHTIGRLDPPGRTNPWMQKHIFPGGYIPALSEVAAAVERTGLITTDIEILRDHYARTLNHWRKRFLDRRDDAVRMFGEPFARLWEFYLAACELAFVYRGLSVFQYQLARRIDTLPIRRSYIPAYERQLREIEQEKLAAG